jgi:hypothetical protein
MVARCSERTAGANVNGEQTSGRNAVSEQDSELRRYEYPSRPPPPLRDFEYYDAEISEWTLVKVPKP